MKAHFANARPMNRILAGELCLSGLVRQHEGCREGEHGASSSFQREVTVVGKSFSVGNPRCPRGSRRRGVEPRCPLLVVHRHVSFRQNGDAWRKDPVTKRTPQLSFDYSQLAFHSRMVLAGELDYPGPSHDGPARLARRQIDIEASI